jgi:hypothetical protein
MITNNLKLATTPPTTILFLLTVASTLHGQVVAKPSSVTVMAVPGYTSPSQDVRFVNTGDTELSPTVSIDNSVFTIADNRCLNGVKPGTHCDIYIAYTPDGIETDNGTLTFTTSGQSMSVPLTGEGVQSIPTITNMHGGSDKVTASVIAPDGYKIPDGEPVNFECQNYGGGENKTGTLAHGKTTVILSACNTQGENYSWSCDGFYVGDGQFAPSWNEASASIPSCE